MLKYRFLKHLPFVESAKMSRPTPPPVFRINFTESYIKEAYRKTDEDVCLDFVQLIHDYLKGEISAEAFLRFQNQHDFELIPTEGVDEIHAEYHTQSRKIHLYISRDYLEQIALSSDLEKIAKNIWTNFTHEDTHAQQQKLSRADLSKDYVQPENLDWNDDLEKYLPYFDQFIEADAYGRELANRLLVQYSSKDEIYEDVAKNKVKDNYAAKTINIYKNPKCKNSKKFFRAFFDVLQNNEL